MNFIGMDRQQRNREDRRIFWALLIGFASVAIMIWGWNYGPGYLAYRRYIPQDGDLLFQSLPHSRLVNAIEGGTQSPYSHCGIVAQENGEWVVYEAYRNVEATPLRQFVFRGRNHGFAAYRLNSTNQKFVAATLQHVKSFLGRPYDSRYRMDDENIYCSELIFKAYRKASGRLLGTLVRLQDLNWQPFRKTIEHYEKGPVPLNREMITPRHMAEDPQVECVFAYRITVVASQ